MRSEFAINANYEENKEKNVIITAPFLKLEINWAILGMPSKWRSYTCTYHKIDMLIRKLAKRMINFVENAKMMTIKNTGGRLAFILKLYLKLRRLCGRLD